MKTSRAFRYWKTKPYPAEVSVSQNTAPASHALSQRGWVETPTVVASVCGAADPPGILRDKLLPSGQKGRHRFRVELRVELGWKASPTTLDGGLGLFVVCTLTSAKCPRDLIQAC